MTQTESMSLEQVYPNQAENPGGLDESVQEAFESSPAAHVVEKKISGFWRRTAALFIDVLVLAAIGFVAGALFFNALAQMGTQGFWVGILITLAYFSWMNSSYNNGQTIGKRVMKIRVVDVLGNTISLVNSIKRSVVLLFPFMYFAVEQESFASAFRVVALFIMAGIVYLYIFNSRTRQTMHDLALKTFVVHADYNLALEESKVPSRHLAGLTLAGALTAAFAILAWPQIVSQYTIPGTTSTLEELQNDPNVYRATVNHVINSSSGERLDKMEIAVTVKRLPAPIYMKAKQISELAMQEMPAVKDMDSLSVTVNYGYNIGIAWYQKGLTYTGTPTDWESNTVKIAKSAKTDVSLGIGSNFGSFLSK